MDRVLYMFARRDRLGAKSPGALHETSSPPDEPSKEYDEAQLYFGHEISDLYHRLENDAPVRYGADYDVDAGRDRFMARLTEPAKADLSESMGKDSANQRSPLVLTLSFGRRQLRLEIVRSARADDRERTAAVTEAISASPSKTYSGSRPSPSPHSSVGAQRRSSGRDRRGPAWEDVGAVSFWDALDPIERDALRSVASCRTFAPGATIMEEGERADHVMVILGGRAKVCVHENDHERVLAIRGLGQLVGERGALQVSTRSASVIALDMIWALVVRTKDFRAFISAHPRVLDIVQSHIYQRHIDEMTRYGYEPHVSGSSSVQPDLDIAVTDQPANAIMADYSRWDPQRLSGENCTVILTDVVEFGARTRTDSDRLLIREALFKMTQAAMQDVPDVRSEDRGDGFLTVVPPKVPAARVIDQLLQELPTALERHNRAQRESARFKLRSAVNVGPVVSDAMGVSGEAIIVAARLVEAPHFKEAIVESTANLGVIASPFVYETLIRHSADLQDAASYSQVSVEVKESDTMAWMKLVGTGTVRRIQPGTGQSATHN